MGGGPNGGSGGHSNNPPGIAGYGSGSGGGSVLSSTISQAGSPLIIFEWM